MSIERVLLGVIPLLGAGCLTACEFSKVLTGLGARPAPSTLIVELVAQPTTGQLRLVNGANAYQCNFAISAATVGGKVGERAVWEYGRLTLVGSPDGLQATVTVSGNDYVTMFGASEIARGQPPVSGSYSVNSTGPFSGSLQTYYVAGGAFAGISLAEEKATTTSLVCH